MAYLERPVIADEISRTWEVQGLARTAGRFGLGRGLADAGRVHDLTQAFVASGIDPATAAVLAQEQDAQIIAVEGVDTHAGSDEEKANLTQRVRELEAQERPSRQEIADLRAYLNANPWGDSSWKPEAFGGWSDSSSLLSDLNEVHARVLRTEGRLAPAPTWTEQHLATQTWYHMPEATIEEAQERVEDIAAAGRWVKKQIEEGIQTGKKAATGIGIGLGLATAAVVAIFAAPYLLPLLFTRKATTPAQGVR